MANYKMVAVQTLTGLGFDDDGNPMTVTYNIDDVVNRCVWDGETPYEPPPGIKLVLESD